jgi:16S rRNA (adenine1518-N6/adenine1519-N6)-dimethyltransferase
MNSENNNNLVFNSRKDYLMTYVKPKKGYGQHFLKDGNIARKIVNSLDYEKSDNVLEIGPGTGVLTRLLLERNVHLKVVELDQDAVTYLHESFDNLEDRILPVDFLKLNLSEVFEGNMLLIGNLPYNISSQIFLHMLRFKTCIPEAVFMIQREVADRIAASPGSKTYGILSVILQSFYDIQILFQVSPKVFHPPPKVNSAVIKLIKNDIFQLPVDETLFFQVVKRAFNQRRKTLRNALKSLIPEKMDTSGDIFSKRAEQLSKEDFCNLTGMLEKPF